MNMLRITIVLVAAITGISCSRDARTGAAPMATAAAAGGVQPDDPEDRLHHPADHPVRAVPVLMGIPTKEMWEKVREGKALLGGDVGTTGQSAIVCDQCRMWKTDDMKYWQPLPKEFGQLAGKNGG